MAPRARLVASVAVFAAVVLAACCQAQHVASISACPATGDVPATGCELSPDAEPSVFQLTAGTASTHSFTLTVDSGSTGGEFHFVRHHGYARLFVSADGQPASPVHYTAASRDDDLASTVLAVPCPTDAATDTPCVLHATVVGDSSRPSAYAIHGGLLGATTPVTTGASIAGTATSGQYVYYSWAAPTDSNGNLITFTVTAYSGDPDIYVSTSPSPTMSNSMWSARQWSSDQVEVATTNEPNRCTAPCTYYIGIYAAGAIDTSFSLLANYGQQTATLTNGQPQQVWTGQHAKRHFVFTPPVGFTSLEIDCMPSYGDPDLYVDVKTQNLDNTGYHDYTSNSANGEDKIMIYPTDAQFTSKCSNTQPCPIYINVYAYQASGMTLVASTNEQTKVLMDGVPFLDGAAANEYSYYALTVLKPTTPVTITLTPMLGDPDMYVSCTVTHPNAAPNEHTWMSIRTGVDQVVISGNDACTVPAVYYIGVRPFGNHNATYTLLGWVAHDGHPIELQQGIRQDGTVAANTMVYYQLTHNGIATDIEFILDTRVGNAVGFVNNAIDPATGQVLLPTISSCTDNSCTATNAKWSTQNSPGSNSVTIPIFGHDSCVNCVYVIGVYAHAVDAEFSLTAVTSDGVMTLGAGWPVQRSVVQGDYDYYRSWVWSGTQDLTFTLTSFYGDADLYVSQTEVRPSNTKYTWAAASGFRDDVLVIQASQITTCTPDTSRGVECELFLAVRGFSNTSYSLLLQYSNAAPVAMSAGQPLQGFVNTSKYEYYKIFPPSPASVVHITVTPAFGDPDLYVTVDGSRPGTRNSQYRSTALHGTETVTIPASACDGCEINIAVWGYRASGYTIQYTLPGTVVQLREGSPTTGHSEPYTMSYFSFYNPGNNDITVALTTMFGDPDIYVGFADPNDPYNLPTWGDYKWASVQVGADVVYIPHTDNNYCTRCTYVVGVYGFTNSTFTITATTEATSIVQLVDGLPQLGAGQLHQYRYFSFRDHQPMENVTFRVTPITGSASVFVTNTYVPGNGKDAEQGQLPTAQAHLWSSWDDYSSQWGTVTITAGSPHWHDTVTGIPYTIGVLCADQTVFQIVAETSDSVEVLRVGVPSAIHDVAQGENQRFKFYMPSASQDLMVSMTVFSGGPSTIMSSVNTNPTCKSFSAHHNECYNFTWHMPIGSDVLTVSHQSPCQGVSGTCTPSMFKPGFFFVDVFGNTESMYSLVVMTPDQSVALTAGVPVTAVTSLQTVCVRDSQTEECTGSPTSWTQQQGVNFEFTVAQDDFGHLPSVSFTVSRACNFNSVPCTDTLVIYALVCSQGSCIASDKYPSPVNSRYSQVVSTAYNSLVLTAADMAACSQGGQPCSVFASVYKQDCTGSSCTTDLFRAVYTTQDGTEVIPSTCTEGHLCPTPVSSVSGSGSKTYAAYLNPGTTLPLVVQLQACTGSATAYLCHDPAKCTTNVFKPSTPSNYEYSVSTGSTGQGWLEIEPTTGAWFTSVVGSGVNTTVNVFELNVAHSSDVPQLSTPQVSASVASDVITVSWSAPVAKTAVPLNGLSYKVYAIPTSQLGRFLTTTPCGLAFSAFTAQNTGSSSSAQVFTASTSSTSAILSHVTPHTQYTINVVATCGPNCVYGTKSGSTQKVAFVGTTATSGAQTTGGGPSGGGLSGGAVAGIVILILAFLGGVVFAVYWQKFRTPSTDATYGLGTNQYNAL